MEPSLNLLKASVWKLPTSPKIKVFLWKTLSNAIPAGDLLLKRGMKLDPVCQTCGFQRESVNHIVFTCPVARQVWALADIPIPMGGFSANSYFSNFHHLLDLTTKSVVHKEVLRAFPWIIWFLWKNRNGVVFDGLARRADELILKIRDEVDFWFLAQAHEEEMIKMELIQKNREIKKWCPPNVGWLKCNVGVFWNKHSRLGGGSWVVRNDQGVVILHSRRAFFNCSNIHETRILCLSWAIDSMVTHRLNRVIFAIEDSTLLGIITRPSAWPSFKVETNDLLGRLSKMEWWRVVLEDRLTNTGAFLISQSVTRDLRTQSYVATGAPLWLKELFDNEIICV